MSRSYRITVSQSQRRHIKVDDGICAPLELLPVLPVERMRALLEQELSRRGFEISGTLAKRDEGEGVTVEIDLEAGAITLRVEEEKDVTTTAKASVSEWRPEKEVHEKIRKDLKAKVEERLEENLSTTEEHLRREATDRLEGKLRDLRGEIDDAITRVTGEALKEKARSLGEIEELQEDPETGSLMIKVRL